MDTTRKQVNIDGILSHRNGIMPYIRVGENEINFVETISSEGNYGHFVCDFVLVSGGTYSNGLGVDIRKEAELHRMRYLDIIRRYNFTVRQLSDSVVLKKEETVEDTVDYLNCSANTSSVTHTEGYRWTVEGTETLTPYNCEPVDKSFFYESDGFYYFDTVNTVEKDAIAERIANGEDVTEEEISFKERVEHTENVIENQYYIVLIPNFKEVDEYDKWWDEWWNMCYNMSSYPNSYSWEMFVFDENYRTPAHLKFVQDVEKYILGIIPVPRYYNGQKIDGISVPRSISYLNFYEYKDWFDENQGASVSDDIISKEWKERGGDPFYAFLCSVTPVFLRDLSASVGNGVYFSYSRPNIEMNVNLVSEGEFIQSYKTYEYKINVLGYSEIVETPFETPTNGQGSALTPSFLDLTETSAYVESRLTLLADNSLVYLTEDLYGIAEQYNSNGSSQLFECTFFTGYSSVSRLDRFYTCELYEYAKYGGEYVLVNTIHVPKTYMNLVRNEVSPKIRKSGTKQVVGIEVLGLKNNMSAITINTENRVFTENFEGTELPVSAFTYITGETIYEYSWCECKPISYNGTFKCGDGETVDFTNLSLKKYRNVTLLSSIPSYVNDKDDNTSYYFMSKYKNGNYNRSFNEPITQIRTIVPLRLPYVVGKAVNVVSFDGEWSGTTIFDMVTEKSISGGIMTFRYVMGATSGSNITTSGIHYVEDYEYSSGTVIAYIDGAYESEVYVDSIKKRGASVHSEDYKADRTAYQAKIEGMEIGTQWTSGSAINALLFTEETTESLFEHPDVDVDILFNRGNAAAWERHFKLSECNTLEDLENYGNGFFLGE